MPPIAIPDQLKKLPLRYGLLQGKLPPATEMGWEDKNNFTYDHPTLLNWLKVGWNYSVICGYANLVVIDSDFEVFTKYMDENFPETFTAKTRRGKHWYSICPGYDNLNLKNKVGEVKARRVYVVGPNSIHPESKQRYEVIKDVEVVTIAREEMDNILREWVVALPQESAFDDPFFTPTQYSNLPDDAFIKYLDTLIPQKCILQQCLKSAPTHTARVALCAWLHFLKFNIDEAYKTIDKLAEFARWDDRENEQYRHYQIRHVMSRGYKPFSCDKLAREGWCIGGKCSLFKYPNTNVAGGQNGIKI